MRGGALADTLLRSLTPQVVSGGGVDRVLDRETWTDFQFALASFGTALLIVELVLHRRGWSHRFSVPRDALLGGVALLSVLAWWTPVWVAEGRPETALGSVHMTDAFHYYMGPKYFPELGFTQLYVCTAAAEVELGGRAEVAKRVYRDLETNEGITGRAILAKAGSCRERFTPEAWERFVQDVDFFRQRVPFWALMMQDWGYNATPAWNVLGALLVGTSPVTEAQLLWLTRIDIVFLLASAALIVWAFGWRTLCVVSIFWGANVANAYAWMGGTILRHEWVLASVAGVCLLRKQRPLAAGMAITYATTLTIFPGFLAAGIGIKAIGEAIAARRIRLSQNHRRLLLGAALALAVVLPASLTSGGVASWADFVTNSRMDSGPSPNNMGLPSLLSYDTSKRLRTLELVEGAGAGEAWSEFRQQSIAERRPLQLLLVLGLLGLSAGAARRQPDWIAALLGLGFVVFAFDLSCYYFVFMALFGLLWPRHRALGVALCATGAASLWIAERWPDDEDLYAWLSLLAVVYVAAAAAVLRFAPIAEQSKEPR